MPALTLPCQNRVNCPNWCQAPLDGLSSEAADAFVYTATAYVSPRMPLNAKWGTFGAVAVESGLTQAEANARALSDALSLATHPTGLLVDQVCTPFPTPPLGPLAPCVNIPPFSDTVIHPPVPPPPVPPGSILGEKYEPLIDEGGDFIIEE